MKDFFARAKDGILNWTQGYLQDLKPELARINSYGPDVSDRLFGFMSGGKALRGGLVMLFEGLYGGTTDPDGIAAGAAMEFFQAALLIHDDIMDQDTHRRGMVSVHEQYRRATEAAGFSDTKRTGESLGICAGDASFFFGFGALSRLGASPETLSRIQAMCAAEMYKVSIAQMQDVANGASPDFASEEDIAALYRHKTGRYTFSLPMMTGALLGGCSEADLGYLSALGEELGIIFQLRDDYLGLYGDPVKTGKPVGSDIAEGKQTLYFIRLMNALPPQRREEVQALFGTGSAGALETVRSLLEETGVLDSLSCYQESLCASVKETLRKIPGKNAIFYKILEQFIDYNLSRHL